MKALAFIAGLLGGILAQAALSAALMFPQDGWVSWEVPAVESAPAWCCHKGWREADVPDRGRCELDSDTRFFGSRREDATVSEMRMYARFTGGRLTAMRSLSPACEIEGGAGMKDLGRVAPDESARKLAALLPGAASRERHDLLAAIAVTRGDVARDIVAQAAAAGEVKARKEALFWLAHLRGRDGHARVLPYLFDDPEAAIRQHAAFAISQSRAAPAAPHLIRQATTDREPKVRSQAWFWLAQTQDAATEPAIDAALRREPERRVREQAIFALSQLPGERAVKALTGVIQDRGLAQEDRKKAVFWMGQVKSEKAIEAMDRLLEKAAERRP